MQTNSAWSIPIPISIAIWSASAGEFDLQTISYYHYQRHIRQIAKLAAVFATIYAHTYMHTNIRIAQLAARNPKSGELLRTPPSFCWLR